MRHPEAPAASHQVAGIGDAVVTLFLARRHAAEEGHQLVGGVLLERSERQYHARREVVCTSHIENQLPAHFRGLGIEAGADHRLRHSYGTSLERAGVRPRIIQELMRHQSLETTMRYLAVDDDEKRAGIALLVA